MQKVQYQHRMNYPGARQSTAGSLISGKRFRNCRATRAVAAISERSGAAAKRSDRIDGLLGRDAAGPDFHSPSFGVPRRFEAGADRVGRDVAQHTTRLDFGPQSFPKV